MVTEFFRILDPVLKGTVLHEPTLDEEDLKLLSTAMRSTYVSTFGPFVGDFEHNLKTFTQSEYVCATSNGTSALHLGLKLLGVESGHIVIVPTVSFIATANAVSYCGATCLFADVEPDTLGLCPDRLLDFFKFACERTASGLIHKETQKLIQGIIVVHVLGMPARLEALLKISKDYGIFLIEDAAEALGSFDEGFHCGTRGHLGVLSFNGNKVITTGGGGALLTQDPYLAKRAKHMSTTARTGESWEFVHDEVGYNYRLPNLNAALGLSQLEKLPHLLNQKKILAQSYQKLAHRLELKMVKERAHSQSNHWLNALFTEDAVNYVQKCIQNQIGVRPLWQLLHESKPYMNSPRMPMHVAPQLAKQVVCLPSSPKLASSISQRVSWWLDQPKAQYLSSPT